MSDEINPTEPKSGPETMEIEQIKQIYDYTKYHIGLYSTLLTVLIALVTFSKGQAIGGQNGQGIGGESRDVIFRIIIMLLVGGIAGALVASRIVYGPWQDKVFLIKDSWFWKNRWEVRSNWWWSWADICLTIEHYAFWLALFYAIWSFARH